MGRKVPQPKKVDILHMNRSEYILRRLELLRKLDTPVISEAKENYGELLSDILFCHCDKSIQQELGLIPHLKGASGELWTSPSDLLIGKVCLKPPLTSKHIRALTHQGILDIGLKIERQLWNQTEIEKEKALGEQEKIIKLLCETEKKKSICESKLRMQEIHNRQRMDLLDEVENQYKEDLDKIRLKMRRDMHEDLKEQEKYLEQQFEVRLNQAVQKATEEITVQSSGDLERLEEVLQSNFKMEIKKAEIQSRFYIERAKAKCKDKLKDIRHELECKNMANMMYVICMERRKCQAEKEYIEQELHFKISQLERSRRIKTGEIGRLRQEVHTLKRALALRENCLLEVLKQYQKFIYFALKSCPKQAEYLLCIEKMMVFELAESLSKVKAVKKPEEVERTILYARTPEAIETPPRVTSSTLVVKDHHKCLDEPPLPKDMSREDLLAGFYYNHQMFVREDFRNMVSQGKEIPESNMLWSEDMEEILQRLKEPSFFYEQAESGPPSVALKMTTPDAESKLIGSKRSHYSHYSMESSVHFRAKHKTTGSGSSLAASEKAPNSHRTSSLKQPQIKQVIDTIDFEKIGSEENRKTLLGTKNSVDMIKDAKRNGHEVQYREDTADIKKVIREEPGKVELIEVELEDVDWNETKGLHAEVVSMALSIKDSLLFTKTVTSKKLKDPSDVEIPKTHLPRKAAKLTEVKDSLTLIREDIASKSQLQILKTHHTKAPINCDPDCNILKYQTSSEILEEKAEDFLKPIKKDYTPDVDSLFSLPKKDISIVNFDEKMIIYTPSTGSEEEIKPTMKDKKRRRSTAKNEKLKLPSKEKFFQGDSDMNVHLQSDAMFTADRINSFMSLIKDHPNLIRLFTCVTR